MAERGIISEYSFKAIGGRRLVSDLSRLGASPGFFRPSEQSGLAPKRLRNQQRHRLMSDLQFKLSAKRPATGGFYCSDYGVFYTLRLVGLVKV